MHGQPRANGPSPPPSRFSSQPRPCPCNLQPCVPPCNLMQPACNPIQAHVTSFHAGAAAAHPRSGSRTPAYQVGRRVAGGPGLSRHPGGARGCRLHGCCVSLHGGSVPYLSVDVQRQPLPECGCAAAARPRGVRNPTAPGTSARLQPAATTKTQQAARSELIQRTGDPTGTMTRRGASMRGQVTHRAASTGGFTVGLHQRQLDCGASTGEVTCRAASINNLICWAASTGELPHRGASVNTGRSICQRLWPVGQGWGAAGFANQGRRLRLSRMVTLARPHRQALQPAAQRLQRVMQPGRGAAAELWAAIRQTLLKAPIWRTVLKDAIRRAVLKDTVWRSVLKDTVRRTVRTRRQPR
eukprot:358526-Chlamydomonas_euryale.AAC.8